MTRTPTLVARLGILLLATSAITCTSDPVRPDPPPPVDAPTKLAVVTQPSSASQNGQVLSAQPVVELQDDDGTVVVPEDEATVTAAVEGGAATLGGTLTQTVDANGRATFDDLQLSGPAGTYRLRFTSGELTAAVSDNIVLGGGPPSTVTVTTQPPTTALRGEVFEPAAQPVVRVTDAGGNPIAGVEVTASVASGGGTLEGVATGTTDADGVAAFLDLGVVGTGAQTLGFTAGAATGTSSPFTLSPLPPEASTGRWDPPVLWDIVPLHMHLMPTGRVLAWGKAGQPFVWNPSSNNFTMAAVDTMLFCAGHAFMPDGRLLVSGGHLADDQGLQSTNIFDPASESWVPGPLALMARGRWYPTVTTLPDGRLVTVAGRDANEDVASTPEVWTGSSWTPLPGADLQLPYYPRNFVAPNGLVFYAGERILSLWLDVNGSTASGPGRWTSGPSHQWSFNRDYGSAVMYETGKILYAGGGGDPGSNQPRDVTSPVPTETVEIIDLNNASPSWSFTSPMSVRRRHLNATVLPDGQVLVTGGLSGGGFNNIGSAVRTSEIWNPATGNWTTLASNTIDRGYHAVSMLLPDATVVHGSSGDADIPGTTQPYPAQKNHEIFRPPYLFRGARPTIDPAPATVGYGQSFEVSTPNGAQITQARWIRIASTTHSFDQNGRASSLTFSRSAGGVSVTAPASANLAPPGHYVLYLLNRNGVPSIGKMIKIQ